MYIILVLNSHRALSASGVPSAFFVFQFELIDAFEET